jgi:hypothetical protein
MRTRISRILQSGTLSLFLFFTALYYLSNAGDSKLGDETYMILVARNMVTNGQLGFAEKEITSIAFWDHFAAKGPDGLYYMKWGLGQSLVEVPFLFLHRVLFATPGPGNPPEDQTRFYLIELAFLMLCPSVISALGCVLFYLLALRLGFSRKVSVLLTLVYGLATMVWPYSKSFMSETTLNVAILGSVYGALGYVQEKGRPWIFFSGVCLGFAVLTKVTALLAIPVIAVYILGSLRTRKSVLDLLVCFVPPLAIFCALQGWHNWVRYGDVWQAGYQAGSDALGFVTPLVVGLWGLLLSPGKSFFIYAPATLLMLLCLTSFVRYRRGEALLFLGMSMVFVLFHARWWSWAGDWAWGPRFLLVITPYVLLPCGMLLEQWKGLKRFHRLMVLSLILLSVGIQFLGVAVHPFSYIEIRGRVLDHLMAPDLTVLSYRRFYTESALAQFSPLFSHIIGNWWLLKHMLFPYDLWSDTPWSSLGHFDLEPPLWVIGDRAVPFWWPVGLPLFSAGTKAWVYPLALMSALMLLLGAIRVGRLLKGEAGSGSMRTASQA